MLPVIQRVSTKQHDQTMLPVLLYHEIELSIYVLIEPPKNALVSIPLYFKSNGRPACIHSLPEYQAIIVNRKYETGRHRPQAASQCKHTT